MNDETVSIKIFVGEWHFTNIHATQKRKAKNIRLLRIKKS